MNFIFAEVANAYFIHKASCADIQGLKIFEIGEKLYLHLLRNNYEVFVGKSGDKEIDFTAEKNGKRCETPATAIKSCTFIKTITSWTT